MRRVVVTGLGVVAPNGIGREAFWSACLAGRSGVGPIRSFDASGHPVQIAAEVPDFDVTPFLPPPQRKSLKIMGRAMRFAVGAAGLSIADSGLSLKREDPERVGVVMGTGLVPVDLPELAPALAEAIRQHVQLGGTLVGRDRHRVGAHDLADVFAAGQPVQRAVAEQPVRAGDPHRAHPALGQLDQ